MSAIFKSRKTPRHLVIEQEIPMRKKRRLHLPRILLLVIMALMLTWVLLQLR
jgi:hypothetical protein